jgi:serine/threonine-protein kinase RsbW
MKTITLSINSDLEQVALVCACVSRLCAEVGLDEITSYQMELCASEALNNVVTHAYSQVPGGDLYLTWTHAGNQLTMQIADHGKPMDTPPELRTEMPPPESEGGRGWPLIYTLMDEVRYESDSKSNRLRLTKNIDCSSAPRLA